MFSLLIFIYVLLTENFKHCQAGHTENQKGWLILLILLNWTNILTIMINFTTLLHSKCDNENSTKTLRKLNCYKEIACIFSLVLFA